MKNLNFYFLLFFLVINLFSCTTTESGCGSIDECLSSYDFEGARKLIGDDLDSEMYIKKITISESKFWADKGEIDRALTIVDESWGIDDYFWSEADWQQWRYNIIDKGVSSCCEKGNYKQAKIYALKAADDINVDGFKIGSGTGKFNDEGVEKDYNPNNGAKEIKVQGPSMRESLLKKIAQFEELVN